jgi:hypothetical protein
MLDRRADRRHTASARQRRYRRRLRDGAVPVMVDVSAAILTMLVATGWLAEADSGDRWKIGEALSAMLKNTAQKYW